MAATGKFWNGYLLVNAIDMSTRVKSATLNAGKEQLDLTCMGCLGKLRGVGIEDHSINVTFEEDLSSAASAGVDVPVNKTLRDAYIAGAPFDIHFALNGSAPSQSNPVFGCNYILDKLPLGGAHGALLTTTVTFISSDAAAMTMTVA
jgi:hypothetical protein